MIIPRVNIEEFDYELPQHRIAQYPVEQRDLSNLLVYNKGEISKTDFFRLPEYIEKGSALVFNNSKVISARLLFQKESGAHIEIFCLEPFSPIEYQQNLQNTLQVEWKCLIGNKKKWKQGILSKEVSVRQSELTLFAEVVKDNQEETIVKFSWENQNISFGEILELSGKIPIPPYLMRDSEELDKYRYQTIYSRIKGSVAAPTAGLHFTPRIFEQLEINGVLYQELTLHVGAGTFKPVQAKNIADHPMHEETFLINLVQLEFLKNNIGNIIAVGTTSTRLLESIYQMGVKCLNNEENVTTIGQWDIYKNKNEISALEAIESLIEFMQKQQLKELIGHTSIMIVPGYQFKMIKALVTNFHQPRSTLILLIAAFIGDDWKKVYQYALENGFRFLSYGDGSLLLPKK